MAARIPPAEKREWDKYMKTYIFEIKTIINKIAAAYPSCEGFQAPIDTIDSEGKLLKNSPGMVS